MPKLVVATRNRHKFGEIAAILAEMPDLVLLDLNAAGVPADPVEDRIEIFDTFEENARAKARYFATQAGLPVLADDSGLCVDALEGRPGVHSKRFSGRHDLDGDALDRSNNELLVHLLALLDDVLPEGRRARYECVVALAHPDGRAETFHGRCAGVILPGPKGSGGFGYDPLFFLPEYGATFGELDPAIKNRISHRAEAVRAAAERIPAWLHR